MKRKIRDWLYNNFLPRVTREQYKQEVAGLRKAFDAQQQRIAELEAYISGVQDSIKMRARIEIKNEVNK